MTEDILITIANTRISDDSEWQFVLKAETKKVLLYSTKTDRYKTAIPP